MKRTWITISLLLFVVLLLVGSVFLYRHLTSLYDLAADLAAQTGSPAEEAESGAAESEPPAEIPDEESDLEPAADFAMTDRNGDACKLSDYFGKPVIINFWATWCGPCQAELPYFQDAYAEYGDQIQFLMVDLVDGSFETQEGTIAFAEDNGYSFPLFFDSEGEGAVAYGINAIPFTVAITANGRIAATHLGSMSEADLQELIDSLLKK